MKPVKYQYLKNTPSHTKGEICSSTDVGNVRRLAQAGVVKIIEEPTPSDPAEHQPNTFATPTIQFGTESEKKTSTPRRRRSKAAKSKNQSQG